MTPLQIEARISLLNMYINNNKELLKTQMANTEEDRATFFLIQDFIDRCEDEIASYTPKRNKE